MVRALVYLIYIGVMTAITVAEVKKQVKSYEPKALAK